MRIRRWTAGSMVVALALAGGGLVACGDDGDPASTEEIADLSATFENFRRDLDATGNIEEASDDVKDGLKDDCGALRDQVESDALDRFCDDLEAAIDDEDQTEYQAVRARFASDVETPFREYVSEAVEDADDDAPLEGGDAGDDDDAVDDDGLDNPFDDNDGDGN